MKKAARLIVFASAMLPLAGVCDTAAERERRTDEIAAWLRDEPRGDVKPFAVGMSAQQSVIEIAAVDVGDSLHLHSIKKIGPKTLRSKTLFRVGRTLRLDMNLLRDSVHIVPNRGFLGKGADLKNQTKANL